MLGVKFALGIVTLSLSKQHKMRPKQREEEEAAAIPALPPHLVGHSMGDSASNGCGQAQIFPSAQARNISTHSVGGHLPFLDL